MPRESNPWVRPATPHDIPSIVSVSNSSILEDEDAGLAATDESSFADEGRLAAA